jgi:hypothetical protein
MAMKIPIACTLSEAEMRDRRKTILDSVRGATRSVTVLPAGYAYYFEAKPEVIVQLARLVDLERVCCAFLTFRIVVEAGSESICLEITGPPEAQAVIGEIFGV